MFDSNVDVFDPCSTVSKLVDLGVNPDGAAQLCASYYGLCASLGGSYRGAPVLHVDGGRAYDDWHRCAFGRGLQADGTGHGVDGGVGGRGVGSGGRSNVEVGVGGQAYGDVRIGAGGAGDSGSDDGVSREADVASSRVVGEMVSEVDCRFDGHDVVRGKNYVRNKAKRQKMKQFKLRTGAEAGGGGSAGSVCTVDTRTGVEIEAAQSLAARRVAENKVATKLAEHRLKALNDEDRSVVIDRLAAARLEERINTAKAKSQKSFGECSSPLESVGSAMSASEFAFKQMVRKVDAEKKHSDYLKVQLSKYYAYSPDYVNQMVAEIPEPYIPTEREMEEEDGHQSPFLSQEEMEADAARFQHG